MSSDKSPLESLPLKKIFQDYLIITTVNKNYLKIFDVWYHYFKKTEYTSILRVITLDKFSDDYVSKKSIKTIPLNKSSSNFSKIILWRFETIYNLLKEGKNIIHTDADAIWLNPNLENIINEKYDIQVSIAYGIPVRALKKWGFTLCTGFMILQSRQILNKFYQDWLEENAKIGDDQISFNNLFLRSKNKIWKSDSTTKNNGYLADYDLYVEAIDFNTVTRFIKSKPAIFHPYLHSDNQNFKFIDLVNQLKRIDSSSSFLDEQLKSAIYNPIGWIISAIGWFKVKYFKGKRKIIKKFSSKP